MITRTAVGMAMAAALALMPLKAFAAGALAVGITANPSDGLAFGTAWNHKTEESAREDALAHCREFKNAPKAARRCRISGSFKEGCLAIAFDPKNDSPGVGWAIGKNRKEAADRAMGQCRDRAPPGRAQFCKVTTTRCEGDPPK